MYAPRFAQVAVVSEVSLVKRHALASVLAAGAPGVRESVGQVGLRHWGGRRCCRSMSYRWLQEAPEQNWAVLSSEPAVYDQFHSALTMLPLMQTFSIAAALRRKAMGCSEGRPRQTGCSASHGSPS